MVDFVALIDRYIMPTIDVNPRSAGIIRISEHSFDVAPKDRHHLRPERGEAVDEEGKVNFLIIQTSCDERIYILSLFVASKSAATDTRADLEQSDAVRLYFNEEEGKAKSLFTSTMQYLVDDAGPFHPRAI